MIELIFTLGFLEPCAALSIDDVIYRPNDRHLKIAISQRLKKNPSECGLKDIAGYSYAWIVVDGNGNQIDQSRVQDLPAEVGLKKMLVITNPMLPKDFKPPLTFKVVR